jgi:hypothetical protein
MFNSKLFQKMANKTSRTTGSRKSANPTAKSVYQMTMGGRKLKKYASIRQAGVTTGVDPSNISKVTRGVLQTAGGFRWQTV